MSSIHMLDEGDKITMEENNDGRAGFEESIALFPLRDVLFY